MFHDLIRLSKLFLIMRKWPLEERMCLILQQSSKSLLYFPMWPTRPLFSFKTGWQNGVTYLKKLCQICSTCVECREQDLSKAVHRSVAVPIWLALTVSCTSSSLNSKHLNTDNITFKPFLLTSEKMIAVVHCSRKITQKHK